ncbi:hypothetical protein MLD38_037218 [Melastoma candidum]|uniref:Uncharacterized protein n=1 Tax=Melastoma candidum TaxID=119954 RepID=A0ACB9LMV3_9MYRT|nr:hypothetical protein MLD38_037218 [Melastoma candidum]
MNINQFESMLSLLHEGLSNKSRMFHVHGYKITKGRGYYVFKFLVPLSVDRIDKSARRHWAMQIFLLKIMGPLNWHEPMKALAQNLTSQWRFCNNSSDSTETEYTDQSIRH